MTRLAKLQFFGPLAVLIAVGMAEGAAFALEKIPTSETLWYVNLKVFAVFQTSYGLLCSSWGFPYSQLFLIALPPFLLATTGVLTKRYFLLALASHLTFAYAGFVFYCGLVARPHALVASLIGVRVPIDQGMLLPLILVGACFISFIVSQSQYILLFLGSAGSPLPSWDKRV